MGGDAELYGNTIDIADNSSVGGALTYEASEQAGGYTAPAGVAAQVIPIIRTPAAPQEEPLANRIIWWMINLARTLVGLLAHDAAPRPAHAPDKPQLDPAMAGRHPLRILLAEDNVVNQKPALRLLPQMGYRADLASNGIEAVESVARQAYDVVLMDVQMPEMDGLEATRLICARWPGLERPRIVAMTANAMQGDREMCLAAGMDDHLAKPVTLESLRQVIGRWLPAGDERPDAVADPGRPAATMRAALDQLAEELGGRDAVAPLIGRWDEELPGRVAALEQAAATADGERLRTVAHTLRGGTSSFGGTQVAGACTALELAAAGQRHLGLVQ